MSRDAMKESESVLGPGLFQNFAMRLGWSSEVRKYYAILDSGNYKISIGNASTLEAAILAAIDQAKEGK